jgi:uncharacterized OB-fold protein
MGEYAKPLPVPDAFSEEFWRAAKEHRLCLQRCRHCGTFSHPPEPLCANCLAPDAAFEFAPLSGRGRISTWTVMRDAFIPAFRPDIPWVIVVVELAEQPGLRVLARLVDGASAPLALGAEVEVVFEDVSGETTLPQFRLRL